MPGYKETPGARMYKMRSIGMSYEEIARALSTDKSSVFKEIKSMFAEIDAVAKYRSQRDVVAHEVGIPWQDLWTFHRRVRSVNRAT